MLKKNIFKIEDACFMKFFFLIYFLVNKLTNEKKFFWLAMFYQKIGQNVTFDFRASYRT